MLPPFIIFTHRAAQAAIALKHISILVRALAFMGAAAVLAACVHETAGGLFSVKSLSDGLRNVLLQDSWQPWADCRQTFGSPTRIVNGVAAADPAWQADNLVLVPLPWKAHAAWNRKLTIRSLQVHRLAAPSLTRALAAVWDQTSHSQAEIDRAGLSSIGGGYNWRPVREGSGLSTHAYGCAVDFDPDRNAMGDSDPNLARPENRYIIDDFRKEGWMWGGTWPHPDGMHFQAVAIRP